MALDGLTFRTTFNLDSIHVISIYISSMNICAITYLLWLGTYIVLQLNAYYDWLGTWSSLFPKLQKRGSYTIRLASQTASGIPRYTQVYPTRSLHSLPLWKFITMRIRVRGPSGQSTITLDDTATIKDLQTQIAEKTGLATFDVKYGYPLKPLELDSFQQDQRILEVGINLNGESLIVAQKEGATRGVSDDAPTARTVPSQPAQPSQPSRSQIPPENTTEDPPEIASPEHAGTFVLRVMPDDNSCLFRAVGAAIMGDMDTMVELRSIIAGAIQSNPSEYTAAILGKKPDEYCTWIQNEDSWGGAIELKILSEYFNIEICSIDVQTLHIFQFNEGAPTRCIVVYSGIHYDVLALSPSRPPYTRANPLPHGDTKIFEAVDPVVLQKAKELCRVLQGKHYYTDTSGFTVRCNVCGGTFTGERGATKHAAETGHYDFGEAS